MNLHLSLIHIWIVSGGCLGSDFIGRLWQKQENRISFCSFSAFGISGRVVFMKGIYIKKGSMTVEAACVMSLILLVLMGLLYLCFFVHNRAWLTAAAYEACLLYTSRCV